MKEYPRLFNGEMVRAILVGRKTQTRVFVDDRRFKGIKVGDRLWVRETWQCLEWVSKKERGPVCYKENRSGFNCCKFFGHLWRPSIHMPRWASRITLEVTGVRVEKLQDISEEDALREGIQHPDQCVSAVGRFMHLWNSLYPKRGWDKNEEVRVIEFSRRNP